MRASPLGAPPVRSESPPPLAADLLDDEDSLSEVSVIAPSVSTPQVAADAPPDLAPPPLPPPAAQLSDPVQDQPTPEPVGAPNQAPPVPAEPPAWVLDALDQAQEDSESETDMGPRPVVDPGVVVGPAVTPPPQVPEPLAGPPPIDTTSAPADAAPVHAAPADAEPPPLPPSDEAPMHAIKAWLEFMSGPDRGQAVPIGPQLSVGQSDACGMSVPGDTRMSPTHCLVQRTPTGFVLRDSGSATGTVVNGQRIDVLELQGGETIMVGRTVLRFRMEAG